MNFSHLAINVCLIGSVSSRSVSPNVTARTMTRIRMATKVRIRQRLLRLFPGALYSPDSIQPRGESSRKCQWKFGCESAVCCLTDTHTHVARARTSIYQVWTQRDVNAPLRGCSRILLARSCGALARGQAGSGSKESYLSPVELPKLGSEDSGGQSCDK